MLFTRFAVIRHLRYILPSHIKWSFVNSIVLSTLDYCAIFYYYYLTDNSKIQFKYRLRFSTDYSLLQLPAYFKVQQLFLACFPYNVVRTRHPCYLFALSVKEETFLT